MDERWIVMCLVIGISSIIAFFIFWCLNLEKYRILETKAGSFIVERRDGLCWWYEVANGFGSLEGAKRYIDRIRNNKSNNEIIRVVKY